MEGNEFVETYFSICGTFPNPETAERVCQAIVKLITDEAGAVWEVGIHPPGEIVMPMLDDEGRPMPE